MDAGQWVHLLYCNHTVPDQYKLLYEIDYLAVFVFCRDAQTIIHMCSRVGKYIVFVIKNQKTYSQCFYQVLV